MAASLKNCPFCDGKVEEHPNPQYRENYLVCYHNKDCYLCSSKEPYNFTLIPKNYMVTRWNTRS